MTEVILDIKAWGNNLGVRLPASIVREAHLIVDRRVRLSNEGSSYTIEPVLNEPLTLEQLLDNFDPELHGGEAMSTAQRLGAERW